MSSYLEWLFWRKNFATTVIFSQKDAAWPQGGKKNFVQLWWHQKRRKGQKDAKKAKTSNNLKYNPL